MILVFYNKNFWFCFLERMKGNLKKKNSPAFAVISVNELSITMICASIYRFGRAYIFFCYYNSKNYYNFITKLEIGVRGYIDKYEDRLFVDIYCIMCSQSKSIRINFIVNGG